MNQNQMIQAVLQIMTQGARMCEGMGMECSPQSLALMAFLCADMPAENVEESARMYAEGHGVEYTPALRANIAAAYQYAATTFTILALAPSASRQAQLLDTVESIVVSASSNIPANLN